MRLLRAEQGNLGDYKSVGEGVFELRFHFDKGLRVYYGLEGKDLVLLLIGGNKDSQRKDIKVAKEMWHDYKGGRNGS